MRDERAPCASVVVTCEMPWHARWPGLRVRVSVLPAFEGVGRAVRHQRLRFVKPTPLVFSVYPGELLTFELDAVVSGVIDLYGGITFLVPTDAAGRDVVIHLTKSAFLIVYGRFRGDLVVQPVGGS
jgi:hypothetical protein